MGYFNINSILYNFRKIFKYLSISLAFISFIIVCLLLMTKDVKAVSVLDDLPLFPSDALNYTYHVVTHSLSDNIYYLYVSNGAPFANGERYVKFGNYGLRYIYNPSNSNSWVYERDFPQMDLYSAMDGRAPIIYTNNDIKYYNSNDVWMPATSITQEPYIALPNDSTQAYIDGEFVQFMVVGNDDIEDLQFFLIANPDVLPTTNSLELSLDDDSPYYLDNYTPSDGGKVFLISKYNLPQGYTNDTLYHAWLAYRVDNQTYLTDVISWTTNFTAKAIENDRINLESGMADNLSNVRSFLFNTKVNYGNYNLPNITFDFDQEHFLSDLFENIRQAFIGNTYTDFEFTFPFSEETITIPSNYVELHCPSIIVNLIRLFYWYIIGRYILKDVFRTIDKMRQGDWFLRSDGNIKTEVL